MTKQWQYNNLFHETKVGKSIGKRKSKHNDINNKCMADREKVNK